MEKNKILLLLLLCILAASIIACQKEDVGSGTAIQDLFYVENQGAKMPVLMEGNIDSGVILLWVHGGPGGTAIGFQNDEFISAQVEPKYAVAYWDQRAAGGSQGSGSPKLDLSQYVEDLKKVVLVLKSRYGANQKIFLLSHSWGGLIAPAFLTEGNNQDMIAGWINVAGAHNYIKNDSLTRDYLLSYGREQILKENRKADWQKIVDYAQVHVPDYTYETSIGLNACAGDAENLISDIHASGEGLSSLLFQKKKAFSLTWMLSNAGATYFSALNDKIMFAEYSSKLYLIKLPLICITGEYDFTCPKGLADEVMLRVASTQKRLVILPHSGHICMSNEPEAFYAEVNKFVEENR
ncbi:alpha/beta fold hydrolase [Dyadobacter arcticus]|uniref:Pimeloyl-ACP methyl ester carboxylesterase n=1 Tax=Dyadobacter arcticus TaxID=1078754 RepID=A0ABX0ULE9_9BACT|nr:alpha/beta hydrolase [Dyadobacter arcticus]NIJ52280.1 pimeloyl-ACP methyl ester carboxylesterase [Dyadobacter arcticus]